MGWHPAWGKTPEQWQEWVDTANSNVILWVMVAVCIVVMALVEWLA